MPAYPPSLVFWRTFVSAKWSYGAGYGFGTTMHAPSCRSLPRLNGRDTLWNFGSRKGFLYSERAVGESLAHRKVRFCAHLPARRYT